MEAIKTYKEKLLDGIEKCMTEWAISERSAAAIDQMARCWLRVNEMCEHLHHAGDFTAEDAEKWAAGLVNEDGTYGAHWDMAQTAAAAESIGVRFEHITKEDWYITMNVMYSDYSKVADKYGVGMAEFYADMAKAFLFDKDAASPKAKLEGYYHGVVEREK